MTTTIIEKAAVRLAAQVRAGGIAPAAREIEAVELPALLAAVCLRLPPDETCELLRRVLGIEPERHQQ